MVCGYDIVEIESCGVWDQEGERIGDDIYVVLRRYDLDIEVWRGSWRWG